jgi:hypothetical protein
LERQRLTLDGELGVQVESAFTRLNSRRMQIAREEKSRTDKIEGDLVMVRGHCEGQMARQRREEDIVQGKIEAARERGREARALSRNQKGTVKGMIKEMQGELEECDKKYIDALQSLVAHGLFEKAQMLIEQNDERVQEMIRGSSESVNMMIQEVEDGKKRLIVK